MLKRKYTLHFKTERRLQFLSKRVFLKIKNKKIKKIKKNKKIKIKIKIKNTKKKDIQEGCAKNVLVNIQTNVLFSSLQNV